jgi:hypothetical protein
MDGFFDKGVNTMATATKQRTNWRQVIDLLIGKTEKALEGYGDLVTRMAAGEDLEAGAVEKTLDAAGKTADDLEADVARRQERIRLAGEIERLERLAETLPELGAEETRLVTEHNRRVGDMLSVLEPKLAELRQLQNERTPCRSQADDARRKLADTADDELHEQERAVQSELREALAEQTNATGQFHEMRLLAESAEANSDRRAPEYHEQVLGLKTWMDRSAKRVRDLQSRLEEIAEAKVKP